jgi:uncharacterized YkwD family protein
MNLTKKKLTALFFIFILILLFSNILGAVSKNYAPKYGTTISSVNFRSAPNTSSSSIIKTLPKGTAVKMVAEIDNFYVVQTKTNEIGYISKSYVKATSTPPAGAATYYNLSAYTATVNSSGTIVRGGPSTSFRKVTSLSKGTTVQVIGRINNFSLIVTSNNVVGMIRQDLITKVTTQSPAPVTTPAQTTPSNVSNNEQIILNLMNAERAKNGLPALKMDSKLLEIARLKSNEMVAKDYFLHTSPTYGTPFTMMKNFGISYKEAGENIAGNPSLENAVKAWMGSEGHRKNVLSSSYNFAGVGVTKSDKYGYVVVAMFIGE